MEPDTPSAYQTDNMIVYPYTATRSAGESDAHGFSGEGQAMTTA